VLLRPVHLRKETIDEKETIREVFDDLVYLPDWFEIDPRKVKTVLDIGALIGSFSLWAHEKWPKAEIFAFEPDPESYEFLLKNIKESKAEDQ